MHTDTLGRGENRLRTVGACLRSGLFKRVKMASSTIRPDFCQENWDTQVWATSACLRLLSGSSASAAIASAIHNGCGRANVKHSEGKSHAYSQGRVRSRVAYMPSFPVARSNNSSMKNRHR